MKVSSSNAALIFFIALALAVGSLGQTPLISDETNIEDEVVKLLKKRDITDLADELARKKSQSLFDQVIKLSVFARAGHRDRVRETLKEIAETRDAKSVQNDWRIQQTLENSVKNDLAAQKIYYELIIVADNNVSEFTSLWLKKGDVKELEKWLAVRARHNERWWNEWFRVKQSLGAAEEVYTELAQSVRENPKDWTRIEKYLRTVGSNQNVAWLADVVPTDFAYNAYELGTILRGRDDSIAAKLFEKSLSLPFTEKDLEAFGEHAFRYASIPPIVKNPEKQLRFWTKKALADVYLKTNQPQLAQPLIEELTAMDTSDIQAEDVFNLAGGVQASSGQRVVESKILQDEAQKESSPQYWLERARYYEGRGEKDTVWQTFMRALERFDYKPNDYAGSLPRLQILYDLKRFADRHDKKETEEILRREFKKAGAETDAKYLFELARMISDNLLDEFFVNTELLLPVLATRENWSIKEVYIIGNVMEREAWDTKKREILWNQLSRLARKDLKKRAFSLADAMSSQNFHRYAVPLLEEILKTAPKEYEDVLSYKRSDVERELIEAYIQSGNWLKAEKMFISGHSYRGNELGKIAVAAAKSGNIGAAARMWKMNANLDRRNLHGLEELAKTETKFALREFYLQMKKRDPLSDAPGKALQFLQ